jgi:hypothetical protein
MIRRRQEHPRNISRVQICANLFEQHHDEACSQRSDPNVATPSTRRGLPRYAEAGSPGAPRLANAILDSTREPSRDLLD